MSTNVDTSIRTPAAHDALCTVPCYNEQLVREVQTSLPTEVSVEAAVRLFAALSDPTRLRLLLALDGGAELCVCDLAHVIDASFSTTSHHLRKLRDLGLLTVRNDGRMVYYAVRDSRLARLARLALLDEGADA